MHFSRSKRTTPYLPAFQVWISDHPHPQNDVCEHARGYGVGINKRSRFLGFGGAMDTGEGNES